MSTTLTAVSPKIYVGTYAKYNSGSLHGKWLDLSDFSNKEDFLYTCSELHYDEADPELMFQDWEGIPAAFISESYIVPKFWEWWSDIEPLSLEEREAYMDYTENMNTDQVDFKQFQDAYQGCYKDQIDFAEYFAEEIGFYASLEKAGINASYFDAEAYSRDLFCGDFWISDNGHVFAS